MLRNFWSAFIRMSAFVRKEIVEVIRQPRLLFTLVLGPFLILLIFGIGYRNEARSLRTVFVAPEGSQIRSTIEEYATSLGEQLIYSGVVADEEEALARLRRREVDVVAVTPADAFETIRSSQQAVFNLYHYEIDPFQIDYVTYFGQVYIDEVNRRVLLNILSEGQQDAVTLRQDVQAARDSAASVRQALQAGDAVAARQGQTRLSGNVDALTLAVGATLGVLGSVEQTVGSGTESDLSAVRSALDNVQQNSDALGDGDVSTNPQSLERVTVIEAELASLDERLSTFAAIDPAVLVRPFRSETHSIASLQPGPLDYFAPAVVALLLQHLAITFAALSIVRERSVGTMELFRVSPLSAIETLLGKYLSYMLFGGILAAILTLLLVFGLRIPMLGNWWNYVFVVAALLFTSLGIGFIISLLSQTDSQAVQLTMIILLTSVFFSGFITTLDMISKPVQVVSWSLPTTYGIVLLREIMLRGSAPNLPLLLGLAAIGVGLAIIAWFMLRRMITTRYA